MNLQSSNSAFHEASNHDDLFIQQSLLFSDTLKDLKTLRKQLYSAAEYFEASYAKDEHKQLVLDSLRDYGIKALVNTVDHLGSVAFKITNLLDERIEDISITHLKISTLELRVKTCKKFISLSGSDQQSLLMQTPKHHKRYIFSDGETGQNKLEYHCRGFGAGDNSRRFKSAVRATIINTPPSILGKESSKKPQSPIAATTARNFIFSTQSHPLDKGSASPLRLPFVRSSSILTRSISPTYTKKTVQLPTSEPRRLKSQRASETEDYSKINNGFFKALLSMRSSRKDSMLYNLSVKK